MKPVRVMNGDLSVNSNAIIALLKNVIVQAVSVFALTTQKENTAMSVWTDFMETIAQRNRLKSARKGIGASLNAIKNADSVKAAFVTSKQALAAQTLVMMLDISDAIVRLNVQKRAVIAI